jgi:hypothetical protein
MCQADDHDRNIHSNKRHCNFIPSLPQTLQRFPDDMERRTMRSSVIESMVFLFLLVGRIHAFLSLATPHRQLQQGLKVPTITSSTSALNALSLSRADEVEDDREYARVRRRRQGRGYKDDDESEEVETAADVPYDARTGRSAAVGDDDDDCEWVYVDDDEDENDEDGDDDEDEDDWSYSDDFGNYNLLGNELIPNPLLDSVDPDGAADRFHELARDPRFWFDMVLFVAFLDLLSLAGPRDPFPDLPYPY